MKNILFISDVHIKDKGDLGDRLLKEFVDKAMEEDVRTVVFLGDIIDLMVGPYQEYLKRYSTYFNSIEDLVKAGKEVIVFEGNHDFHTKEIFECLRQSLGSKANKLSFYSRSIVQTIEGIKIFMGHGDDIELENPSYRIYKGFITSRFIKLILENLVNYKIVDAIGSWLSSRSRKRNKARYELDVGGELIVRDRFRKSAEQALSGHHVDYLVCGHSHVQDKFRLKNGAYYLNNGFALRSRTYIKINNYGAEFMPLNLPH